MSQDSRAEPSRGDRPEGMEEPKLWEVCDLWAKRRKYSTSGPNPKEEINLWAEPKDEQAPSRMKEVLNLWAEPKEEINLWAEPKDEQAPSRVKEVLNLWAEPMEAFNIWAEPEMTIKT